MVSHFICVLSTLLLCSVVRVAMSQDTNFTGPGYIACPFDPVTAEVAPCVTYSPEPNCTLNEVFACNITDAEDIKPAFDTEGTTVYLPLFCNCIVAVGCNNDCMMFTGEMPTSPPVSFKNFSGVGSLTCPLIDTILYPDCYLEPSFVNDDISSCGTCNPRLDEDLGFSGGSSFTFPLLCDCLIFTCPDTCTFTEGNVTSPTPDVVAPTVPTTTTVPPTAAPGGTGTTSSPTTTPGEGTTMAPTSTPGEGTTMSPTSTPIKGSTPNTTAPISSPVAKTPAAIPTPVVNNSTNGTSSAKLGYSCSTVLFTSVGIIIVLSLFN